MQRHLIQGERVVKQRVTNNTNPIIKSIVIQGDSIEINGWWKVYRVKLSSKY